MQDSGDAWGGAEVRPWVYQVLPAATHRFLLTFSWRCTRCMVRNSRASHLPTLRPTDRRRSNLSIRPSFFKYNHCAAGRNQSSATKSPTPARLQWRIVFTDVALQGLALVVNESHRLAVPAKMSMQACAHKYYAHASVHMAGTSTTSPRRHVAAVRGG